MVWLLSGLDRGIAGARFRLATRPWEQTTDDIQNRANRQDRDDRNQRQLPGNHVVKMRINGKHGLVPSTNHEARLGPPDGRAARPHRFRATVVMASRG